MTPRAALTWLLLAALLALGVIVSVILWSAFIQAVAPCRASDQTPAAQLADPLPVPSGMTTERVSPLPSPDKLGGRGGRLTSPTPTSSPVTASGPVATSSPAAAIPLRGVASTYGPGWDGWLALPDGPGIRVRICGPAACAVRVSNDAGPDLAMQRAGRVADLDVATFELVCGVPWTRGLCRVTVRETP